MRTLPIILLIILTANFLNAQKNTINEFLKISADDGLLNDKFGKSIAMNDNYVIVGADLKLLCFIRTEVLN